MAIKKSFLILAAASVVTVSSLAAPVALAHGGHGDTGPGKHRRARMEHRLDRAVENGKITEAQKAQVMAKLKELKEWHKTLKGLSPQERHEAIKQKHEEMKAWFEQNNIPKPPKGALRPHLRDGLK
jgi:Spy/CpxP family protein refolding chaperone